MNNLVDVILIECNNSDNDNNDDNNSNDNHKCDL